MYSYCILELYTRFRDNGKSKKNSGSGEPY